MIRIVLLAIGIFLLFSPALAWTQHPNVCSDEFWKQTLRCQNAADPSTLVLQPAPAPPVTTGQLKDFTRVPLDDDDTVRCLDGTVPVLYIDEAVDGPSNNWLFTFSGGMVS